MRVVVRQSGERGAEGISVKHVETGVDLGHLELGGGRVLGLDDANAGVGAQHAAVATRLGDAEGRGGASRATLDMGGKQVVEQFRRQQRRVARDDQHIADKPFEGWHGAAHSVARAELVGLDHDRGVTNDSGNGVGLRRRHDDDDPVRTRLTDGGEHPAKQRATPDRMQHLWQGRAHARALATGHHDAGERTSGGGSSARHPAYPTLVRQSADVLLAATMAALRSAVERNVSPSVAS